MYLLSTQIPYPFEPQQYVGVIFFFTHLFLMVLLIGQLSPRAAVPATKRKKPNHWLQMI